MQMQDIFSIRQQAEWLPDRKFLTIGKHITCDLSGCDHKLLSDATYLQDLLQNAVRNAGATIIGKLCHEFDDGGVTIVIGLQESHASIHTWPQENYAAFDVYTCGETLNPEQVVKEITDNLRPTQTKMMTINRGLEHMNQDWVHDEGLPYYANDLRMDVYGTIIYDQQSLYQRVQVYDTGALGRVLRLDKIFQTSEKYSFIYDEVMGAMPALLRPNPKQAFIVGGGDLGTMRTLLQLKSIEKVINCEIDEAVVSITKQFLPSIPDGCFDDPRAEIVYDDAKEQLEKYENTFDLIASDLTDPLPDSPAEELYQPEFFRLVKKALRPDGIFASHCGLTYFQSDEGKVVVEKMREIFEYVEVLVIPVPNYGVGTFTFLYASAQPLDISLEALRDHYVKNVALPLRYASPEVYFASKTLPPFVRESLGI